MKSNILKTICLVFLFSGCSKDLVKPKSELKIPFNEFSFSTKFDLPQVFALSYEKMTDYTIQGKTHTETSPTNGRYAYYLNGSDLPTESTFKVHNQGPLLIFESAGAMPRIGDSPSSSYNGALGLWDNNCHYNITVYINPSNPSVIPQASLQLFSGAFDVTYDLKDQLLFTINTLSTNTLLPEWSVTSKVSSLTDLESFKFSILIDDVYGTQFKK